MIKHHFNPWSGRTQPTQAQSVGNVLEISVQEGRPQSTRQGPRLLEEVRNHLGGVVPARVFHVNELHTAGGQDGVVKS